MMKGIDAEEYLNVEIEGFGKFSDYLTPENRAVPHKKVFGRNIMSKEDYEWIIEA